MSNIPLDTDELDAARAEEKRQQDEGSSFADEVQGADFSEFASEQVSAPEITDEDVEVAIDSLTERDGTENVAADDFSDAEELTARGYDHEEPEHYVDFIDKPTAVIGINGDFEEPAALPTSIPFDESPAKQPPTTTQEARQHEGFMWYQMGMKDLGERLLEVLQDAADEDGAAIMFMHRVGNADLLAHAEAAKEWAATQDLDPVRPVAARSVHEVPLTSTGEVNVAELNVLDHDDMVIMICDLYAETQAQAKAIREHNHQLENIEQSINRDEYGGELWAETAGFFNEVMPEPSGDELGMPLLERIKKYVITLQDATLPPEIKSMLQGEPENQQPVTETQKVVMLLTRLKRVQLLWENEHGTNDSR